MEVGVTQDDHADAAFIHSALVSLQETLVAFGVTENVFSRYEQGISFCDGGVRFGRVEFEDTDALKAGREKVAYELACYRQAEARAKRVDELEAQIEALQEERRKVREGI